MANTLNQIVVQTDEENGQRIVVQFTDDVDDSSKQKVVYYNDLSAEQKVTFDNFELLCNSIMNS